MTASAARAAAVLPPLRNARAWAALLVLAFVIGLGMGLCGPISQVLLYEASPPERVGEVMGLRVTAMNLNRNRDYLKADAPEMRALRRVGL